MSAIDHSHDDHPFRPADAGRPFGFAANAERAGREIVWLVIAVAFCVVEAAVFLTDLPFAKLLARRRDKR